uniref:Uncharacterized protein n=1 Tax=Timema cristinae TaxID=61476 RepID=A0A7R9CQL8_TIMCR|nr:unnamed protein product [Timema cristinae]
MLTVRSRLWAVSTKEAMGILFDVLCLRVYVYVCAKCEGGQRVPLSNDVLLSTVNLTGVGRVDMSNFELLKVLGTGAVIKKWRPDVKDSAGAMTPAGIGSSKLSSSVGESPKQVGPRVPLHHSNHLYLGAATLMCVRISPQRYKGVN